MMLRFASFVFAICSGAAAFADGIQPVDLPPMEHSPAQLEIIGGDGAVRVFTQADIEGLDTYRLTTTTPWRREPAEFAGVLLADLLSEVGLADVPAIRVTAENDFTSSLPRALWESVPVLVATRVNGQPHSRRDRGPIQFVIDMDTYEASDVAREAHLVWMAARIEPER